MHKRFQINSSLWNLIKSDKDQPTSSDCLYKAVQALGGGLVKTKSKEKPCPGLPSQINLLHSNSTNPQTESNPIAKYINKGYHVSLEWISQHNLSMLNKMVRSSELYVMHERQRVQDGEKKKKKKYLRYIDSLIGRFLQVDWNKLALEEIKKKFVLLEKKYFCLLNRIKCSLQLCIYCGAVLSSQTVNSVCFENSVNGEDSVIIKELFEDYIDAVMNQEELRDQVS